jgi:RNA polymerase sigma factor (sigma-70 family)
VGLTAAEVREIMATTSRRVVPLDGDDDDERGGTVTLCDESPAADPAAVVEAIEDVEEVKTAVRALLALLPERERRVLDGYYLQGQSLPDLAREFGVSRPRVSQIHSAARHRLQGRFAAQCRSTLPGRYRVA